MHIKGGKIFKELLKQGYLIRGLKLLPKEEIFRGFVVFTGDDTVPFRMVPDYIGTENNLARLKARIKNATVMFAEKGATYEIFALISGKGEMLDEYVHLLNKRFFHEGEKMLLAA